MAEGFPNRIGSSAFAPGLDAIPPVAIEAYPSILYGIDEQGFEIETSHDSHYWNGHSGAGASFTFTSRPLCAVCTFCLAPAKPGTVSCLCSTPLRQIALDKGIIEPRMSCVISRFRVVQFLGA